MNKLLLLGLMVSLIGTSCHVRHYVTLKPDGSAFVYSEGVLREAADLPSFNRSPCIVAVDSRGWMAPIFLISNVDSLGDYLTWIEHDAISFERKGDTLTVHSVPPPSRRQNPRAWKAAHLYLLIEQGVVSVDPPSMLDKADPYAIAITRNARQVRKQTPLDVIIVLKPSR